MTPFVWSFRASLIQMILQPSDTLFDIDSLTLVSFSAKSVINLGSLQTFTLTELLISQQFYFGSYSIRTFSCHLSTSGICSVLILVS